MFYPQLLVLFSIQSNVPVNHVFVMLFLPPITNQSPLWSLCQVKANRWLSVFKECRLIIFTIHHLHRNSIISKLSRRLIIMCAMCILLRRFIPSAHFLNHSYSIFFRQQIAICHHKVLMISWKRTSCINIVITDVVEHSALWCHHTQVWSVTFSLHLSVCIVTWDNGVEM